MEIVIPFLDVLVITINNNGHQNLQETNPHWLISELQMQASTAYEKARIRCGECFRS
jgi:hypothetical protein